MALLTTQEMDLDGLAASYAAAAGGGDTFTPDDRTFLHVKNAGGSPVTVTVTVQQTVLAGQLTVANSVTSVTNGQERFIGPFPAGVFASPSTGLASVGYSGVTSVTVAAVRAPARV